MSPMNLSMTVTRDVKATKESKEEEEEEEEEIVHEDDKVDGDMEGKDVQCIRKIRSINLGLCEMNLLIRGR